MRILGFDITRHKTVAKASSAKPVVAPKGVIGLRAASGKVSEEFLSQLTWPEAGKIYQEMASNDAVIGGCLYLIETLVRQARWRAIPASTDTQDIEAANFLESCMFDMQDQTWDDFICEVLSMLIYGFSFHEIIYKTRRGPLEKDPKFRSRYSDGRIGWQELPIRSQATLSEWVFDEKTGKTIAFLQDPSLVGGQGNMVEIPISGNLLFRTKSSRGNPEGWSILRRAYRSWYFCKYIEELEGIGIERNLAGVPVLQPPEDLPIFDPDNQDMRQLLQWAQELVDGLRQDRNHGLVLPGGWTLKLLGTEGSDKKLDTDTVIRRHQNRIAMSMLSDVILMGGDRTGSFALAETKQGLLITALQSIISNISSVLNTYAVPTLFAMNNWTLETLPKITADNLQPITIKEVALMLRTFKIDITRDPKLFNFLLRLIQAPELTDEEYTLLMNQQEMLDSSGLEDDPDAVDQEFKQSDEAYTGRE